jgi:hypothetical protein
MICAPVAQGPGLERVAGHGWGRALQDDWVDVAEALLAGRQASRETAR